MSGLGKTVVAKTKAKARLKGKLKVTRKAN